MLYQDNESKFVVVLNAKIEIGKLMNTLSHIVAGLVSLSDINDLRFLKYYDADESLHPAISRFPFIILKSKNSNQIRTLRNSAIEQDILFNDFADTMLGSSAEDQLNNTRNKKEIDMEYFGIALFGQAEQLNILTKKFSLFSILERD